MTLLSLTNMFVSLKKQMDPQINKENPPVKSYWYCWQPSTLISVIAGDRKAKGRAEAWFSSHPWSWRSKPTQSGL